MKKMAPFLLLSLVFSCQFIAGFNTELPPPSYGNLITILSIDGGGIRGIIPAVVLEHLENALKAKDESASLANYFDVIAGTSTGGIMTAMLTAPHPHDRNRPLFTPREIIDFYINSGPSIFNETSGWNNSYPGPKYDGKFLHNKARELLQNTRLENTLTNAVIPTFDLKTLHPVIFSNFKLKTAPSLNAKLSDIIIGTSAAPTYLPPYHFENDDTQFNLIDGGVAACNPAMAAVSEVIQQQKEWNPDFTRMKSNEHTKILLLSIGCGASKAEGYDAEVADHFSAATWAATGLLSGVYDYASKDMTEFYLATVFPGLQSSDTYLRIQDYNLDPSMDSLDNATETNLENLVKVGQNLLKQPVLSMNVVTFVPEKERNQGTNAEALERVAEILYKEKELRLKKKSMEKRGRPLMETVTIPFGRTRTS
ncbi:patatin-like protein 1 [Abrus precatorius]|uniref:Patatin n=1 Tax=Abrus precatorius TaxID=3816 RepID=A0A8B8JWL3_ABRPR|nr:patatin-like protein 1 [Abrus precatorius]